MQQSGWTFLDIIFALVIIVSTGLALTKGLVREAVSLIALIAGFLLAAFYYPSAASWVSEYTRTAAVAELIGFMIIFLGSLTAGAAISFLINRFLKAASLQWMDRLLGGIYGFLRGWLVCSIVVLAFIAFPVLPATVSRSYLAPYLLAGARAAVMLVPNQLKEQFNEEYKKVLQAWNQNRNSA